MKDIDSSRYSNCLIFMVGLAFLQILYTFAYSYGCFVFTDLLYPALIMLGALIMGNQSLAHLVIILEVMVTGVRDLLIAFVYADTNILDGIGLVAYMRFVWCSILVCVLLANAGMKYARLEKTKNTVYDKVMLLKRTIAESIPFMLTVGVFACGLNYMYPDIILMVNVYTLIGIEIVSIVALYLVLYFGIKPDKDKDKVNG